MPKLLVHRTKSERRKKPPCGRIITYTTPHSLFQKLLESARLKYGLSTRELARRINTSQSNYWIWTHSTNGYPSPRAFKDAHITAISKVLKIPVQDIKDAVDASRSIYAPGETPAPKPSVDALDSLIAILRNDKRVRLNRTYVLNIALNLQAGAKLL